MDLHETLRRRRMTRCFDPGPVDEQALSRVLDALGHLPTAGFSQGVEAIVLTGGPARARFWAASSEARWRERSAQAPGLLAAPVVVLPVADPSAYLSRYGEPDKAASDLSARPAAAWEVPYWLVDSAFAVLALLLAAEAEGLGALFFRLHRPASDVLDALGVPPGRQAIGAVALGHRSADDRPSGSAIRRRRRPLDELVHRDRWSDEPPAAGRRAR